VNVHVESQPLPSVTVTLPITGARAAKPMPVPCPTAVQGCPHVRYCRSAKALMSLDPSHTLWHVRTVHVGPAGSANGMSKDQRVTTRITSQACK